jgi:hypothetical protein
MTEATITPTGPTTTPGDSKPRTATAGGKPPVVDPDAPYGYMKDPATGKTRPKKAPGRGKSAQAPPDRPSAKPRAARAVPSPKTDYRRDVMTLLDGVWTLAASVPDVEPGTKVMGVDIRSPLVRVKAQAAIMKDNAMGLVNGFGIMAQHSAPVRNFIAKAGDESGPAWILPAMMALLPFAAQSAAMWRAPLEGDVVKLAERTSAEFDELVKGAMAQAEAMAQDGSASNGQDPSGA